MRLGHASLACAVPAFLVAIAAAGPTASAADLAPEDLAAAGLGAVKTPGPSGLTFGIDVSPEFYATTTSSHVAGHYADTSITASLGLAVYGDLSLSGSLQATLNDDATQQYYGEGGIAYRFGFGRFSLTPKAALGVTWDETGFGENGDSPAAYYALFLAGDLALGRNWSWTVFNLRWRDAFDYQWQTPKVATGLSYALGDRARFDVNLGYSWKNTGDGYYGDKINVGAGLRYAF